MSKIGIHTKFYGNSSKIECLTCQKPRPPPAMALTVGSICRMVISWNNLSYLVSSYELTKNTFLFIIRFYSQCHCRWRSRFLAYKTLNFGAISIKFGMYAYYIHTKKYSPNNLGYCPKLPSSTWPDEMVSQSEILIWLWFT